MFIQYASDLHLESSRNYRFVISGGIEPKGDCLVLAGDVAPLQGLEQYREFWDWCSSNFKTTIFVPGNHDYYGDWPDTSIFEGSLNFKIRDNVICVSNSVVRIGSTDFIASTLWSKIDPMYELDIITTLLDFKEIRIDGRPMTATDFNRTYDKSIQFIKSSVEKSDAEHIIVATHHVPSFSVCSEKHKGSALTTGFISEQGNWIINSRIDAWIYGHSHTSIESEIWSTKILSNQLGYMKIRESTGFQSAKLFEVSTEK